MVKRKKSEQKSNVQLVFPVKDIETDEQYLIKSHTGKVLKYLSASVDDVIEWFSGYKVESIELTVSAAIETGTIPKLIIGVKGEGGVTVTLKPK